MAKIERRAWKIENTLQEAKAWLAQARKNHHDQYDVLIKIAMAVDTVAEKYTDLRKMEY